jgi:TP901 family phage tail tape measure protein
MALSKDVVIRLLGDASSAVAATKAAADAAEVSVAAYKRAERAQAQQAQAAEQAARRQMAAYESVGRGMMVSGAVIAAGLGLAAKAAIDWESAWAGVMKTIDGTPAEMNELEGSLRKLATTLPATHEEIAGVAEAAGQLGIARSDVVEFTKVAIAMGVSTNLSAQDAATGMARLGNIMGTSSKDVDRMGSALVALGNAGASTEGEILDMSLRIAAAGRQAGMSEGEVMGLANAMSSLGIEAEAGGTAISTVIKTIGSAVSEGGDGLKMFADVAGTTSSKFATAWRTDAAGALQTVIVGLGRMHEQGVNVNGVIDDLGLGGIRTSDTLLRLAGDADGLAASLALGNKAWAENSALMNEANKRYETTASQIQIARNQISDAAIDIGGVLLPVLASGAEMVADFARGFQELPEGMQTAVTIIGALAATVGVLGGAALMAVPKIAAFRVVMEGLVKPAGGAASAMGKFGLFMTGPWGAAIGVAAAALPILIGWLGSTSRASEDAAEYQDELADALKNTKGAIDDTVRALAAQRAESTKIDGKSLLQWADDAGIAGSKVTDALLGSKPAIKELDTALRALSEEELAGSKVLYGTSKAIEDQSSGAYKARDAFMDLAPALGGAVAENERIKTATEETGAAAATTTTTVDDLRLATEGLGESGENAATAAERLADALDELNGPTLSMRDATRQYQEQLDDIAKAMGEEGWTATLDINTEAGRKNAEMLDDLAKKGADQATAVLNTTGSYDAFRSSLETSRAALIETGIKMGMTEADAKTLADQILAIPDAESVDIQLPTYRQVMQQLTDVITKVQSVPPQTWTNVGVLSAQAMAQLEAVGIKTRTLPDGTVEVYANTGAAEQAMRNFINQQRVATVQVRAVMPALPGTSQRMGTYATGGYTGDGGKYEPAGIVHRGEFVIDAEKTRQYLPMLEAIHSGRPSYATGGGVGIPVGARAAAAASAGVIDYGRLAAALSGTGGGRAPVLSIAEWNSYASSSPQENAEALAMIARTRG